MTPATLAATLLLATAGADALTSERAVALALERNPELAALAAEARAAEARLEGARAPLPSNPELSAALGPRRSGGERTTDVELGLSQRLEIFGERSARIDVAAGERDAASARLAARRVELAASAREAHARALAAERLAALAREELAVAREAARAAERRAELGSASRLEVNAARGEVGRAARAVGTTASRLAAAQAALRTLLAAEPGEGLPLAGELPRPSDVRPADGEALVRAAAERRGDVAAARRSLAAAEAEQRLARREALPSPVLGARYAREERADVLLGTLSFELPLFDRNQAGRGAASARAARAGVELAAATRRAGEEVQLALARLRAATEAASAFDDGAVSGAEENLALSTRAYEAGKIGLADLLLMRRSAVEARRDHVEALEELAAAEAALARAAGSERLVTRDGR
ncbi:putative sensor with HAMP domain [Anaeromyxobacter dehalogenans 2CP-1]|uniref:Sensor with HAMP domain n=1 Tax=Anaeromyxobacter dehalogenans (strain ATCC BAA-258 / DSM 21875 / 2CP-1) TaxID=455488 RepID=B8JF72_ANAD2|nr:TolC family protein [Anaeromyxobacter dehalogenans]ACL64429.1 putative sensor with HAMP domain [Anaeromyxobacter dehalogenans 2CP-1]